MVLVSDHSTRIGIKKHSRQRRANSLGYQGGFARCLRWPASWEPRGEGTSFSVANEAVLNIMQALSSQFDQRGSAIGWS